MMRDEATSRHYAIGGLMGEPLDIIDVIAICRRWLLLLLASLATAPARPMGMRACAYDCPDAQRFPRQASKTYRRNALLPPPGRC